MIDSAAAPGVVRRRDERAAVTIREDWRGGALPALISVKAAGTDPTAWIRANRSTVDRIIHTAGAVLLRGFAVTDATAFRKVMDALSDRVLGYGERSSPRSEVAHGVYTSTDHPPDQPIFLHNEQSYTLDWPMRIAFFCETAPMDRGRTPLADSRRVLARLSPGTVDAFTRLGVRYVRNYVPGISLPWQEVFQAERREDVEAYCRGAGIGFEWTGDDGLRTHQVRPAVHTHPVTGERTWFNHAAFFHVTSLPPEIAAGLLEAFTEEELPYQTYYGDGRPIEAGTMAELHAAYAAETVAFDWRPGDLLVVDNMLAAHGREPFSGPRRILAAMADPVSCVREDREP